MSHNGRMEKRTIVVTGAAGFIGFHLAHALLERGWRVVGADNLSPYYDVRLKKKRLEILKKRRGFSFAKLDVADHKRMLSLVRKEKPDEIVHLAAQAGVRYSLKNPWAYEHANYLGTLSVFEAARAGKLSRVIYASSSSVYGGNDKQPFEEGDRVDAPVSLYAATKRGCELLAHAYNHLFGFETIGLRFFTVYGPWGRPDMGYFKFSTRIAQGKHIDIYNDGRMKRSFTYVDDVVAPIIAALGRQPAGRNFVYNLGGSEAVPLSRFVELIEKELGMEAEKRFLPMQPGDMPETVADCSLAARDLGYRPQVRIEDGIRRFVAWFMENERFLLSLSEPLQ